MSTYPGPDDSQRFGAEPERTGMKSGTKWLLGLGIGCGVVVLLCCGGISFFMYSGVKSLKEGATEDPAKIAQIAESIASVDVPTGLKPKFGIDFVAPIVNTRVFTSAVFEGKDGEGTLIIAQLPVALEDANRENLEEQMNIQMSSQGAGPKKIIVKDSRPLELTIRGKPAKFVIQKGELVDSSHKNSAKPAEKAAGGEQIVGATGTFQGKDGAAMIILQLDANKFTEADVENVLKSIK